MPQNAIYTVTMTILGWYQDQDTLYPVCQSILVCHSNYDGPLMILEAMNLNVRIIYLL